MSDVIEVGEPISKDRSANLDIVEVSGWKFPREWFTTIRYNAYYGLDLTNHGYGLSEANILWFLGPDCKNIYDRFLTKDFTGVKLEQFWEMVEFLAESENRRIVEESDPSQKRKALLGEAGTSYPRRWDITANMSDDRKIIGRITVSADESLTIDEAADTPLRTNSDFESKAKIVDKLKDFDQILVKDTNNEYSKDERIEAYRSWTQSLADLL